ARSRSGGGGGSRGGGSGRGQGGQGGQGRNGAARGSGGGRSARPAGTEVLEAARVDLPVVIDGNDDTAAFAANRRRALVVAAVPALVALVVVALACVAAGAALIGVAAGVVVALVLWLALWRNAPALVLRALGTRPGSDPELQRADNIVEGLCASMGLEAPDIVVLDEDARLALAVGRPGVPGTLVVSTALLHDLDPVALEGVLAHELVHVKRGDTAPATMACAVLLPLARVLPAADLVHAVAGRGREFRTDRLAIGVTRYPPGLRDALVLMAEGPVPGSASPLAGGGVARATRWLWTVALPDTPDGPVLRASSVGELDAPAVRIAALDEW
ncbi:MAG TPA: M48 family metalloprotease, partial [Acidimicrobiales bacterium]|nr:M48 family metalloprotease [Acidimicrobiales bacterium]